MLNSRPVYTDAVAAARITLGVCTYKRPQMLMDCLESLTQLSHVFDTEVSIVIVDNEVSADTRDIVEQYADRSNHPIRYITEPRRGISHARNAIIEAAIAEDADWIAMLDDDQVVPPDWLKMMRMAQAQYGADVVKSSVDYEHAEPLSPWAFPRTKPHKGRHLLKTTQTNGVMFRAALVRPALQHSRNLGLRFDERYALSSGEDRDFFARAYAGGASIIEASYAVATEFVPETKSTYSAQVARVYFQELTNTVQDRRLFGVLHTFVSKSLRFSKNLITGLLLVSFSPFAMPVRPRYGRRQFLRGSTKLARSAAIGVGLLGVGRRPQPYLTIHGG